MKFSEIMDEIAKDSYIDKAAIDEESAKIPYLHGRWLKIHVDEMRVLIAMKRDLKRLFKEKQEYYLGKSPDEVYKEKPLDFKILKQDVEVYIEADTEYSDLHSSVETQKLKVDTIEKFMRSISDRNFNFNNLIKWNAFKNGLNP